MENIYQLLEKFGYNISTHKWNKSNLVNALYKWSELHNIVSSNVISIYRVIKSTNNFPKWGINALQECCAILGSNKIIRENSEYIDLFHQRLAQLGVTVDDNLHQTTDNIKMICQDAEKEFNYLLST